MYHLKIWKQLSDGTKASSPVYDQELHWCMDSVYYFYPHDENDPDDDRHGIPTEELGIDLDNPYGYYMSISARYQLGVFVNWTDEVFAFALGQVELKSPSNKTKFKLGDSFSFKWKNLPGALSYKLRYWIPGSDWEREHTINATGSDITFSGHDVDESRQQEYKWEVIPVNVNGDEIHDSASATRSFTFSLDKPALYYPEGEDICEDEQVTLDWEDVDDAAGYDVYYGPQLAYSESTSGHSLTVNLNERGTWKWKVVAVDQHGDTGPASSEKTFNVVECFDCSETVEYGAN